MISEIKIRPYNVLIGNEASLHAGLLSGQI